jgi:DNA-directed RNA polymerase beta' subunit
MFDCDGEDESSTSMTTPSTIQSTPMFVLSTAPPTATLAPCMPTFAPDTPTFAPDTPTFAPDTPTFAPFPSTFAPDTPTFTPFTSTFAPDTPTFAPDTPTFASDTPTFALDTPTFAPDTPTYAPDTPTYALSTYTPSTPLWSSSTKRTPSMAVVGKRYLGSAHISSVFWGKGVEQQQHKQHPPPLVALSKLKFGLISDKDVVKHATMTLDGTGMTTRRNTPALYTANDPRLGTTNPSLLCSQCGSSQLHCPGHTGKIDLSFPVASSNFLHLLPKILTSICCRCSALLVPRTHNKLINILNDDTLSHKQRVSGIFSLAIRIRQCNAKYDPSHGYKSTDLLPVEVAMKVGWCGAYQPALYTRDMTILVRPVYFYESLPDVDANDGDDNVASDDISTLDDAFMTDTDAESIILTDDENMVDSVPKTVRASVAIRGECKTQRGTVAMRLKRKRAQKKRQEAVRNSKRLTKPPSRSLYATIRPATTTYIHLPTVSSTRKVGVVYGKPHGATVFPEPEGDPAVPPLAHPTEGPSISFNDMYRILSHADKETTKAFGFDPETSPLSSMMIKHMLVPPLLIRPARSLYSEDDLTIRLRALDVVNHGIKENKTSTDVDMSLHLDVTTGELVGRYLGEEQSDVHMRNRRAVIPSRLDDVFQLQRHTAAFYDGKYFIRLDKDFGNDRASVRKRFTAQDRKRARLRGNLLGKRGNYTARAVASPNTAMQPDEVGLPLHILMRLTFPERVTRLNFDNMLSLVLNGPRRYPGANFVDRAADGEMYMVDMALDGLQVGDVVHRHLREGDYVLVNRQPTLHRFSIMAYKVKVSHCHTIQIHLGVTSAKNADFDGDELNVFALGSYEAIAEARELLSVRHNMFKDGSLLVGCVQHSVLGMFKLTQYADRPAYNKRNYEQLIWSANDEDIALRVISRVGGVKRIVGRDIVRAMLPSYDGKSVLTNKMLHQLMHFELRNCVSGDAAIALLGFVTRLSEQVSAMSGVTLSPSDCMLSSLDEASEATTSMKADLESRYSMAEGLWDAKRESVTQEDVVDSEDKICIALDSIRELGGSYVSKVLASRHENGLLDVTISGAKGKYTDVVQNAAMVGQQLNKIARRNMKTTTHAYKDSAHAHGFVSSAFVDGLSATEFFHHLSSSRNGLVATAVSTGETGYLYRKLSKCMEDLRTVFDGSVHDASGLLVMTRYGFETTHLQQHRIRFVDMSRDDIERTYSVSSDNEVGQIEIKRVMLLRREITSFSVPHRYTPMPLSFERAMSAAASSQEEKEEEEADSSALTALEAHLAIEYFWNRLTSNECRVPNDIYTRACFFDWMSTATLESAGMLKSRSVFANLIKFVQVRLVSSVIEPGTPVGLHSAQGFAQPLTQLNLDVFHISGEKTELVGGVARIKELLNWSTTKTPSMMIFLLPEHKIDAVAFVELQFRTTVLTWRDGDAVSDAREVACGRPETYAAGWFRLVIHVNRALLTARRIPPRLVAQYLADSPILSNAPVHVCHSEITSNEWWLSIVVPADLAVDLLTPRVQSVKSTMPLPLIAMHLQYALQHEQRLLGGVKGISDFFLKKQTVNVVVDGRLVKQEREAIVTLGSNLGQVCNLHGIDVSLTTTNDLTEIYEVFGVDACMAAIEDNLSSVMLNNSASVSRKHIQLISRYMCLSGAPLAMTFSGQTNARTSHLKLATFERSFDSFLLAGVAGHEDTLNGVSESVVTGTELTLGTGSHIAMVQDKLYHKNVKVVQSKRPFPTTTVSIAMPPPDITPFHPDKIAQLGVVGDNDLPLTYTYPTQTIMSEAKKKKNKNQKQKKTKIKNNKSNINPRRKSRKMETKEVDIQSDEDMPPPSPRLPKKDIKRIISHGGSASQSSSSSTTFIVDHNGSAKKQNNKTKKKTTKTTTQKNKNKNKSEEEKIELEKQRKAKKEKLLEEKRFRKLKRDEERKVLKAIRDKKNKQQREERKLKLKQERLAKKKEQRRSKTKKSTTKQSTRRREPTKNNKRRKDVADEEATTTVRKRRKNSKLLTRTLLVTLNPDDDPFALTASSSSSASSASTS